MAKKRTGLYFKEHEVAVLKSLIDDYIASGREVTKELSKINKKIQNVKADHNSD